MNEPFDRILVVKLADIGDAVLALPAVQALRASRPNAQIDVLTTGPGANVFHLSSAVDDILTIDKQQFDHIQGLISVSGLADLVWLTTTLRRKRYDAVIILHHLTTHFGTRKFQALVRATGASVVAGLDNGRGHFLTHSATDYGFGAQPEWRYALGVIEALGISAPFTRPLLLLPDESIRSAEDQKQELGVSQDYIVLHPEVGGFSPARAWPIDHFGKLARTLSRTTRAEILTVGVDRNQPGLEQLRTIPRVHDLTGQTTFPELCALVEGASLVIGCDSAVSHIASAFERPAISLFGPSNVGAWKPFGATPLMMTHSMNTGGNKTIALHRGMPCSPCIYTGFRLGRPQGCRSRSCLTGLDPDAVARLAIQLLGEGNTSKSEV
jgi:ADP-heptose:LPS heptosyltransferase